jgi:nicotinamidase-related amidase
MPGRVLVVVDIQREIETEGRPYFIHDLKGSLQNARRVLQHARSCAWTVYHVRHLQEGDLYGHDSPLSLAISGLERGESEVEFIKSDYSCFSSLPFAQAMTRHTADEVVVIGYGSTKCCLATLVDAYGRGQKMTFVADASGSQAFGPKSGEAMHSFASTILETFARVVKTEDVLHKGLSDNP